jgi:hypothetical protein
MVPGLKPAVMYLFAFLLPEPQVVPIAVEVTLLTSPHGPLTFITSVELNHILTVKVLLSMSTVS